MKNNDSFKQTINEIIKNFNLGFFIEAETLTKKILKQNPDDQQLHNIYGQILLKIDKNARAIAHFKKSIKIKANFFDANFNLLKTYYNLKKFNKAISQSKKCLKINSNSIETLILLGNLYKNIDKQKESEKYYNQALKTNTTNSDTYYSLGNLYKKYGEYEKAILNYKYAIKFNNNHYPAYNNLGTLYQAIGQFDLAISNFQAVINIKPKLNWVYQNYLFCLNFSKNFNYNLYSQLVEKYKTNIPIIKFKKFSINFKLEKKIRVGLVSGDFGQHPVSYYLFSIINNIDKKKFELVAYSNSNRKDNITSKLKKKFNIWRKINYLSDQEVINLVKEKDKIDILFDLSGHTAKNRLSIFLNKSAPIQVTWLGYNATTGLREIDYIITDPHVVPLSSQKYYSENIFHLPETFQCISIKENIKIKLKKYSKNYQIIFGSFNNLAKVNDEVIEVWSKILKKINNSKLFLKSKQLDNSKVKKTILNKFEKQGIKSSKIIIEGASKTRNEMLKKYNKVDIALDPFPYPGITTSLEAIWMGVPLITKRGNNFYSRIGLSINKNLNMEDWIADNKEDYIQKAISKSSDLEKLFEIKKRLRSKFLKSPLSNEIKFCKNFEKSLSIMWKNYLEKKI